MDKLKRKISNPYVLYSVLFIVTWSVIILPFFLRGNSLIAEADSFNQSFPVFVYIGNYIKDLLRGNFRQFDFCLGLGDDVLYTLNVHGLGDVFQIISVFVGAKHAQILYEIVMVLKYYLCGIAFLTYEKKYVKNNCYQVSGALMYALGVFVLFYGLNCWMFLNPMISLPFVLCGIDQIIESHKKLSLFMVSALCFQALNGFYYLYMEIIIAALYVCVIMLADLCNRKIVWGDAIKKAAVVALQGVLGCLLGAVFLFPSILGYLSSPRAGSGEKVNSVFQLFFFDNIAYYVRSLASLLVPNVYFSTITIPIIVLLGGIVLMRHHGRTRVKNLMIFFTIAFWIPFVGKIMNGLAYWTNRWYYAVLLFLILGTMTALDEGWTAEKKDIIIYEIVAALSLLLHFLNSEKTVGLAIQIIVFTSLALLLPWIWNQTNHRDKIIICSVVLMLSMNGLLVFGPKILGGNGYSAGFKPMDEAYAEIIKSAENVEISDVPFERLDIYGSSLGSSLVMNYYGTTEYFSMPNSYVSEFYQNLCISPGVRGSSFALKGLDGRLELEALLSTSQYMDFRTDAEGNAEPIIRLTEEKLPLGFTYSECMSREKFDKLNPIEKSGVIVNYLILEELPESLKESEKKITEEVLPESAGRAVSIDLEEVEIEHNEQTIIASEKSRIRVYLEKVEEKVEYYVRFSDFYLLDADAHDIYVGNKNIQLRNQRMTSYPGPDGFWVHVSEFKQDEKGYYFDIFFNGDRTFNLGGIQVYAHVPDKAAIQDRRTYTLENLNLSTNQIQGKITVDKPQALFLSVPYSKGWKAYIDGKRTEITRANIAFMALPLSSGEHEIVLKYSTPGLKAGLIISLLSVAAVIFWISYDKKREKSFEDTDNHTGLQ